MPLDRFAARLKKRLEKTLHDCKNCVLHLCKLETCTYISLAAMYGLTAIKVRIAEIERLQSSMTLTVLKGAIVAKTTWVHWHTCSLLLNITQHWISNKTAWISNKTTMGQERTHFSKVSKNGSTAFCAARLRQSP